MLCPCASASLRRVRGDTVHRATVPALSHLSLPILCACLLTACGGSGTPAPQGDISLTSIASPPTAQSGAEIDISAVIWAETNKYNAYVGISLVRVPPGGLTSIDVHARDFVTDYDIGAMHIPMVLEGEEYEKQHRLRLPVDLPGGDYAVLLRVNELDFTPDDDGMQGESAEDRANNAMLSDTILSVTALADPQLQIVHAALDNGSFHAPVADAPGDPHPGPTLPDTFEDGTFTLSLALDSQSISVAVPVAVRFELEAGPGGTRYPLQVLHQAAGGQVTLADTGWFPEDPQTGHSIVAGTETGQTFQLYLDAASAAWADLAGQAGSGGSVPCTLHTLLDPDDAIPENDETSPERTRPLPVMYLAPVTSVAPLSGSSQKLVLGGKKYGDVLLDKSWHTHYGNPKYFKVEPEMGVTLSHATPVTHNGVTKCQFDANAYGEVDVWVFNHHFVPLFAGADLDYDSVTEKDSRFVWEFKVVGVKLAGYTLPLQGFSKEGAKKVFWPKKGTKLPKKSKKSEASFTYWLGPVPLKIKGGLEGTIGMEGHLELLNRTKLDFLVEPYADLKGFGSADVSLLAAGGGVGVEITLIDIRNPFHAALGIDPPQFVLESPLTVTTLKGSVNAHAWLWYLFGTKHWKKTIVKWNGDTWKHNWFKPINKRCGNPN